METRILRGRKFILWLECMNNIGVNLKLIAATLNLQKMEDLYGDNDWKVADVKEVTDG